LAEIPVQHSLFKKVPLKKVSKLFIKGRERSDGELTHLSQSLVGHGLGYGIGSRHEKSPLAEASRHG